MKKFEELTMEELKAFYDEKCASEQMKQEEIKEEQPKRWRAEEGEDYWYYCYGLPYNISDERTDVHNYNYDTGNYFQTREQADEYKKKLLLQQQYKDWCAFDCNWNDDNQEKYYVFYNTVDEKISFFVIDCSKTQGVTYAQSRERIQEFIDKIGEEDFKKYILEVEE